MYVLLAEESWQASWHHRRMQVDFHTRDFELHSPLKDDFALFSDQNRLLAPKNQEKMNEYES